MNETQNAGQCPGILSAGNRRVALRETDGFQDARRCPLVLCGEPGFSPLGWELTHGHGEAWVDLRHELERFCHNLRESKSGPFIAFYRPNEAPRALALVQDERGYPPHGDCRGVETWYERNRPTDETLWMEYYVAASYALFCGAFERWSWSELEVAHLTGTDWPTGLLFAVLAGFSCAIDACEHKCKELWFNRCCLPPMDAEHLAPVFESLAASQQQLAKFCSEVSVTLVASEDYGIMPLPDMDLCKIDFPPVGFSASR